METFSALLALCAGNSPVSGEFPSQRPVTRSFDVFFDLHLNKQLSKQSWGWWFETPLCSLWRQCNESHRADSRLVPCKWEMALQSNAVSHWLGWQTQYQPWVFSFYGCTYQHQGPVSPFLWAQWCVHLSMNLAPTGSNNGGLPIMCYVILQCTEAWTQWLGFCRQYIQLHFLEN